MSQPTSDIGFCCEQVIIEVLSTNAQLAALNPVHEDVDTDMTNNRIVAQAMHVYPEAPNQINPEKNIRRVEMQIMIRQAMGQSTANQLYAAYGTMCQLLENMDVNELGSLPSFALFKYLCFTPALENERQKEENRRKMIKTLNFLAILA